ncbi:MAG: hypothetical protein KAJ14_04225, partial [Candidatus Omnitrophica bacterium]|nr:hypothetical protein [Candidatus Omnitrophota bacterium]
NAIDNYIITASDFLSAAAQTDQWTARKLNGLKTRIFNRIKAQDGKVSSEALLAFIKVLIAIDKTDEIFEVDSKVNTKSLVNLFWSKVVLSSDQKKKREELNNKKGMTRRFNLCLEFMTKVASSDKLKYDSKTDLIRIVSLAYLFWDKSGEENRLLNLKKFIYALVDAGLVEKLINPWKGGKIILTDFIEEAKKQPDMEQGHKQIIDVLYYAGYSRELKNESNAFEITPKSAIEETLRKDGLFFGKDRVKISAADMDSVYSGIKAIDTDALDEASKVDYYLSLFLYKSKLGQITKDDEQLIIDAFKQTQWIPVTLICNIYLKIINVLIESDRIDLLDDLHTDLWRAENRPGKK